MLSEKYKKFSQMIVYQIYPRSFNDSNGDGIGDIRGIIEKLDYLKDLGINAIWLCPCYKSPNDDNGYDISDYYDIMDEFGTIDDMKELISETHRRGIKIIMDLVPNHTSTQHKWFIESKKSKDNYYSDFYYWFDEPANDWGSAFGGSAWEYCEERNQYYLHSYAVSQADLNWDNPKVVKEMQKVVDYWTELGVDGFRCDVIDQISKDFKNGNNAFGPNLHKYINLLLGRPETENLFTVGECWADTIEEVCRHAKEERKELSTLFQFEHLECGRKSKFEPAPDSLKSVRDILIKWQRLCYDNDLLYTLFTDNHDQPPFISRIGNDKQLRYESASLIATMFYTLRGIPFIYQGQEIGTVSSHYDSIDDFRDVESLNYYKIFSEQYGEEKALEMINFGSRDNERHPISWSGSEYAGFSTSEPWIPLNSRFKEINLEKDLLSEKSVYRYYKKLIALRKSSPEILFGDFEVLSKPEDNYFAFTRTYEGKNVTVICNFEQPSRITLPNIDGKLLLGNYSDRKAFSETFRPYEAVVLGNE